MPAPGWVQPNPDCCWWQHGVQLAPEHYKRFEGWLCGAHGQEHHDEAVSVLELVNDKKMSCLSHCNFIKHIACLYNIQNTKACFNDGFSPNTRHDTLK